MGKVVDKVYFFGAGKIGARWLRFVRVFGALPEGFIDNNADRHGGIYEGIPVYGPDRLKAYEFDYVVVTCADEESVLRQLADMGVAEEKIIFRYHRLRNYMFYFAAESYIPQSVIVPNDKTGFKQKILFDLQNGMVLGGVEAWSYELAKQLKKQGFEGAYLTTDSVTAGSADGTYPAYVFRYSECGSEREIIELCVNAVAENLSCTVICNFPQYTFWSACMAKKMYPEHVRIIAVQHNDDRPYYEAYGLWHKYIDKCISISSHMENKLIAYGMDKDRMIRIGWQVYCDKNLKRTWSKEELPLQIGYAGRVTVRQKRVDLLLEAAVKLRERNIRFCLNIAGTGDYSETLQKRVYEEGLEECINIIGYIDRNDIPDFWKKQDIMLSCSEYEGHSISQSEAMASGAVPVVTDVSGARDDVTDGHNGYVVPIGDMDTALEKICFLYHNRGELARLGQCAYETVYKRQADMDQAAFWSKLLSEVWRRTS